MKKLFGILLVLALVLSFSVVATTPVAAQPPEVWVDDGFDDSTPDWGDTRFDKIQDGIGAVAPGGTVNVAAGTYNEAVTIGKALTLKGPNAGVSAGVDAGTRGDEAYIVAPAAVVAVFVNQAHIGTATVDGFYVSDDGAWTHGGIVQGSAAREGTTVHFLNNIVEAPATVLAHGNPIQVTGDGSTVIGNRVQATHLTSDDWSATGILVINALDVTVEGNLVVGHADSDNGICFQNHGAVPTGTIHNNRVVGTERGIYLSPWQGNVGPVQIKDNYLEDNEYGLRGANFAHYGNDYDNEFGVVSGNTFVNNRYQASNAKLAHIDVDAILADNDFDRAVVVRGSDIKVPIIFSTIEDALDAAGPGDTIEVKAGTYVGYAPLLDAEIAEATISIGEDASASTTSVAAEATGGDVDTIVGVAEFVGNPTGVEPGLQVGGFFFDVHVGGELPDELEVRATCPGGECSGMVLKWFDGTEWLEVSPVSYTNGEVVATLDNVSSSPLISELTGTPFGLGGPPLVPAAITVGWDGSSINKAAVLAPWIALLATMMAGATLLAIRRRGARI